MGYEPETRPWTTCAFDAILQSAGDREVSLRAWGRFFGAMWQPTNIAALDAALRLWAGEEGVLASGEDRGVQVLREPVRPARSRREREPIQRAASHDKPAAAAALDWKKIEAEFAAIDARLEELNARFTG